MVMSSIGTFATAIVSGGRVGGGGRVVHGG